MVQLKITATQSHCCKLAAENMWSTLQAAWFSLPFPPALMLPHHQSTCFIWQRGSPRGLLQAREHLCSYLTVSFQYQNASTWTGTSNLAGANPWKVYQGLEGEEDIVGTIAADTTNPFHPVVFPFIPPFQPLSCARGCPGITCGLP